MVYSPLHCLCADQIVRHFEPDAKNVLFYLKPEFGSLVNRSLWDTVTYLPWPRFNPVPGLFGRLRRTQENLYTVADACRDAQRIVLHTTVIDTEAINYNINFLRRTFPAAEFSIRLFPDGWMNVKRHPLGWFKELIQFSRLMRRIVAPDLHYYRFQGDRTGSDDRLVDRIYLLPRFPHQYDPAKVVQLPFFPLTLDEGDRRQVIKRALVVGQPLIAYKRMTREKVAAVTRGIHDYLQSCGIEKIYYKSHPRDKTREYALADYVELKIDEPLEQHLTHCPYGIIIGVCSTGLLTARMILPDWCRVVACGLNLMRFSSSDEQKFYVETFKQLKVEMVELS